MDEKETLRSSIRKAYATVAQGSVKGCCGSGCGCGCASNSTSEAARLIGYSQCDISDVPQSANMSLGCGNPLALASLAEGETVLDLGCGGGFDCFLASPRVGRSGHVIGVDMTPEMIALARSNAANQEYANVEFRLGEIENLPVADSTVDVIVSNCVINLALDKRRVFREAYRVLKPGGRLAISDVVAVQPLPDSVKQDVSMISGCIGGAELADDIHTMLEQSGFENVVVKPREQSRAIIQSWGFSGTPEDYVASCDIQAWKPENRRIGTP